MVLLLDQQQAYQEEQLAWAYDQQMDVEWWVAQHHDELLGEQVALDA
jgi:hypothetical protein